MTIHARPSPPSRDAPKIIVYDGGCPRCRGAADFVTLRDRRGNFRLVDRNATTGRELLAARGIDPISEDSLVLIWGEKTFLASDAALRIARGLAWPWPFLALLLVVPRSLRDLVYRQVARRRRKAGGMESCGIESRADRDERKGDGSDTS